MANLILSDKHKAFLRCEAAVEFLEGTTYAGKTTVGIFKFMLKVAESPHKQHILSGLDLGTVEKNIINKELGVLDIFAGLVTYNPNGKGTESIPHLVFKTKAGEKIIYVFGYDNRARWKKALGGQCGCIYIDEINVADMDYVREAAMRCDYLMATMNPDDPSLPIYKEYINRSRPLPEYDTDAPTELRRMLDQPAQPGWIWWYFSFEHNAGLTEAKKQQIIANVPVGTKQYKNKILGLRGRATGLVFSNFERSRHLITKEEAKKLIKDPRNRGQKEWFVQFTAGLDTAYSSKSPDTIAMSYEGITNKGLRVTLAVREFNNADLNTPLAPSDTVVQFIAFLDRCREEWGGCRDTFIDSADQATITEFSKYKREHGCVYNFNPAWKKLKVVDRITLQLGWLAHDQYKIVEDCEPLIREMECYSWKADKDLEPEDGNDHFINSTQYAWIPYKHKIGVMNT